MDSGCTRIPWQSHLVGLSKTFWKISQSCRLYISCKVVNPIFKKQTLSPETGSINLQTWRFIIGFTTLGSFADGNWRWKLTMCPLDGSKFKRLQLDQADLGETWTWSGFPKKLKRIHSDHGVSFLEKGDLRYIKGSFFFIPPKRKKNTLPGWWNPMDLFILAFQKNPKMEPETIRNLAHECLKIHGPTLLVTMEQKKLGGRRKKWACFGVGFGRHPHI